jgi:hypothetical protein
MYKEFWKREIYGCYYEISGYHSNELSRDNGILYVMNFHIRKRRGISYSAQ